VGLHRKNKYRITDAWHQVFGMGCGQCISACTYGAIEFRETRQGNKAVVNPVLCKGDGLCNARCPTGAISLKHFTDEEVLSQIDAAFLQPFANS